MTAMNIPIQLISACSTKGELTPLWFRYENEEHGIETIRIEKVVSTKEERYCGMDYIGYICWTELEGHLHLVELRYSISSHQWKLFRLLS